jgi:hypothetical protein
VGISLDANSNKNKTICIRIRKFKVSDKFSFAADDSLEQACNASEGSGVF